MIHRYQQPMFLLFVQALGTIRLNCFVPVYSFTGENKQEFNGNYVHLTDEPFHLIVDIISQLKPFLTGTFEMPFKKLSVFFE